MQSTRNWTFTTTNTFTSESIKEIQQTIYTWLSDRQKLNSYLFSGTTRDYSESEALEPQYRKDSNGNEYNDYFVIPDEITNPPNFSYNDYPLNDAGTFFHTNHEFDYLTTFKLNSFYKSDQTDIRYAMVKNMIEKEQAQSRFSTIWRQLAAVIVALDIREKSDEYPIRYIIKRLFGTTSGEFMFYEKQGVLQFDDTSVASILPTLVYMICAVGTHICLGTITHAESITAINNYLHMAKRGYGDAKLSAKSIGRNWVLEAMDKLGTIKIPKWDQFGQLIGQAIKNTSEPDIVRKTFSRLRLDREKLSPFLQLYIKHALTHCKTQVQVMNYYAVCRVMTNDSTYYKTATELSLDAAVLPKIREQLVTRPAETMIDVETRQVLSQQYPDGQGKMVMRYLILFTDMIAKRIAPVNVDEEWLNFLTTSSPGKKTADEFLAQLSSKAKEWTKTRIGAEAAMSSQYRSIQRIISAFAFSIKLVQRQQIDRRQRGIAGLSNELLFLSFMAYFIGKHIYELNDNAAQGKQSGNALDIQTMLFWTTQPRMLFSSTDISGMDASIQHITKDIYNTFTLSILAKIESKQYGPFLDSFRDVFYPAEGKIRSVNVNGAWRALSFEISNSQTSTTYESKTFGAVQNFEGTFPSGRADTSTHHTVLLQGVIRGNELERIDNNIPSQIAYMKDLGDDISVAYHGAMDKNVAQAQSDNEKLESCGFKTTLEISVNMVILLQQMVVNGTFWGFPDRVSLWTREHTKEVRAMASSVSEMISLRDDINSRVRDLDGLKLITFTCALLCMTRHTIRVTNAQYKTFSTALSTRLQVQEYPLSKFDSTLMTIYIPIAWLFMQGGGEMPSYPFIRRDGTLTPNESVFKPRGDYARRLMFDICNIREMISSNGVKVDHELLDSYGFTSAQFLIELDILNIITQYKLADLEYSSISALATGLEQYGNIKARDRSRKAAATLRVNRLAPPKGIVYGYNLHTKLEQVAMTVDETDSQIRKISSHLVVKTLQMAKSFKIRWHSADILHIYTLDESNERLGYLDHSLYTRDVTLGYNLSYLSDAWYLFCMLGGIDIAANELRREIASILGKYHSFKYDDPTFEYGFLVYSRNQALLPEFFAMINANSKQQDAFVEAFEYYQDYKIYKYKYTMTPRQLFFISDNPLSAERCVIADESQMANRNLRGLMSIYAYTHILTCVKTMRNLKLSLTLHPKLLDYVSNRV
jgi:hypothetical protein